ncbi:Protein-L-isoaspartate O-methyltransferase 1 (AtPIMT1) (L-isoaspartyl protein carboxyl methyltransferase) (Protein L-isoaspartyl methyltransferase) (Protein-beta-aspartate methyltransferase) [Durusdinium trenchii]|uniref:protein-L-isoaspartate(D-aspartate) O-methyltransferase n=1 Tax=Durusdinium trenchii TaxID=1381693 RepID=A0ABP0SP33_9DINO
MAWQCSSRSNAGLVENLRRAKLVQNVVAETAMKLVDRANFVLDKDRERAYEDSPQSIGFDATISAPHMHAMALDLIVPVLQARQDRLVKVLDVGSGSGYLAAALHHAVQQQQQGGKVFAIDYLEPLTEMTKRNLAKEGLQEAVAVDTRDGWKGWAEHAPFDAIHVGAAASMLPDPLVQQLAPGGVMVIPVGVFDQELLLVTKSQDGSSHTTKSITGVRYVPLIPVDPE